MSLFLQHDNGEGFFCLHVLPAHFRSLTPPLPPVLLHPSLPPSLLPQEAGLQAVRKNRYVILARDFDAAYKKHVTKADKEHLFYSM